MYLSIAWEKSRVKSFSHCRFTVIFTDRKALHMHFWMDAEVRKNVAESKIEERREGERKKERVRVFD
jgi:hypothetical protein